MLISLPTATSLIILNLVLNKLTAFYGLLALFTGHDLPAAQLSMYIYSLPILLLTVYLAPKIRRSPPSALHTVAFGWLYTIDTVVNAAYTAAFGVAWFLVLAQQDHHKVPGGSAIDSTSGFTSPQHNVSQVDVVASPKPGVKPGQDAVAVGSGASTGAGSPVGLGSAVFQSGSAASIAVISALWALRFYSVFIVLQYARMVLRQHIATTSSSNVYSGLHTGSASSDLAENPFAEGKPDGAGFKGKIGRTLLSVGQRYWLGKENGQSEPEWAKGLGGKFSAVKKASTPSGGIIERERRRRSGTGPPAPPPLELPVFVGQKPQSSPSENR
ncbi:DUF1753-domain-containing protein, partial [Aulographum hederae CBS 113979]